MSTSFYRGRHLLVCLPNCFLSLKEILRQSPDHDIGPAIAHFLNCFVGKVLGASTKGSLGNAQSKKVCDPKRGNLVTLISATNSTLES